MKHILIYTFLLLTLLGYNIPEAGAQQEQQSEQRRPSRQQRIRGPRLGLDVSGIVWHFAEPDQLSVSVYGDYEIMPAIFTVAEIGRLQVNRKNPSLNYSSKGYFGKIGADYNFLHNKLEPVAQYDMIYGGLRLAGAHYSHRAKNITIQNDYWGDYQPHNPSSVAMQAYWLELVGGIRVEALRNFFLGWSLRGQLLLSQEKDKRLDTWMIPGYGQAENNTSLYFTYTFSYRIPLSRVPAQPPTFF